MDHLTERHSRSTTILLLVMVHCSIFFEPARAALGINYGQLGSGLPPPEQAVLLVRSIGATRVKIFDANPTILRMFANTGIELTVMVKNEEISAVLNLDRALAWVKSNVVPYLPRTNITTIAIGNEVLSQKDASLTENLFPAMQTMYAALSELGLHKRIFVTTPHAYDVLGQSYPPSAGAFRQDLQQIIGNMLDFHDTTGSPFWINAYPYFVYKSLPDKVDINYATFRQNPGIDDPAMKLHYDNLLFAQLDAVHAAIASLGYPPIPVHVAETGWPSQGGAGEIGSSLEYASSFNGNLKRLIDQGKTTPLRPNSELVAYIFALFNENMKPGPTIERNFGLFFPNGTAVYPLTPS